MTRIAIVRGLREKAALLRTLQHPNDLSALRGISKTLAGRIKRASHALACANTKHSREDWFATHMELHSARYDLDRAREANKRYAYMSDQRRSPDIVDHEYTAVELAVIREAEARVSLVRAKRVRMSAEYQEARTRLWPEFREAQARKLGLQAEELLQVG
tara:strand:+ start:37 stop:516 length:480 start_codon:yes stop_codon:yes gene_type:complete